MANVSNPNTVQYHVERSHVRWEGLLPIPVASSDTVACSIIRVSSPVEVLRINWQAVRDGEPPDCPAPELFDTNNVFIWGERGNINPQPNPGNLNCQRWVVAGIYYYAIKTPVGLTSQFPTARIPKIELVNASTNTIPATVFRTDILQDAQNARATSSLNGEFITGVARP